MNIAKKWYGSGTMIESGFQRNYFEKIYKKNLVSRNFAKN